MNVQSVQFAQPHKQQVDSVLDRSAIPVSDIDLSKEASGERTHLQGREITTLLKDDREELRKQIREFEGLIERDKIVAKLCAELPVERRSFLENLRARFNPSDRVHAFNRDEGFDVRLPTTLASGLVLSVLGLGFLADGSWVEGGTAFCLRLFMITLPGGLVSFG